MGKVLHSASMSLDGFIAGAGGGNVKRERLRVTECPRLTGMMRLRVVR